MQNDTLSDAHSSDGNLGRVEIIGVIVIVHNRYWVHGVLGNKNQKSLEPEIWVITFNVMILVLSKRTRIYRAICDLQRLFEDINSWTVTK